MEEGGGVEEKRKLYSYSPFIPLFCNLHGRHLKGEGKGIWVQVQIPFPSPFALVQVFSTNSHRNTCYIVCRLFSRPVRGKVTWEKTFFLVTKQWLDCFYRQGLVFLVSFYSAHDKGWSPFALKRLAPATKTNQWLTQELLLLHLLFFIPVKLVYLLQY